jgi:hypothetical protein
MATPTGATRGESARLPKSQTITICDQQPSPRGEVEVTPDGGRIHFENKDQKEYCLRFRKTKTDSDAGIDVLLPANGLVTILIKRDDEFEYSVLSVGGIAETGGGGGTIKN